MELLELHLFAGAGGGILGGHLLGHRVIGAVEIEAYPRKVLLARQLDGSLPRFPIWDDVTTFRLDNPDTRNYIERLQSVRYRLAICGGFPCQDISAAGKGAGIEGERSGMWKEMARIIGEIRPRYAFVENSPMLTTRGLGTVLGDLAALGYAGQWTCLRASDCGASHERDRWWGLFSNTNMHQQSASAKHDETQIMQSIGSSHLSDSDQPRRQERSLSERVQQEHSRHSCDSWWKTIPDVSRVANGLANQSHRLKAIGNGQVPLCAAVAWRMLADI